MERLKYIQQIIASKPVKHYRKIVLAGFICLLFFFCGILIFHHLKEVKAKEFISSISDNAIIWDHSEDDFINALEHHFLGKNVTYKIYTIGKGDHYWKIAHENNIDIDTIIGSNPHIQNLYASVGEKIVALNKKGVLHYVEGDENLLILSKLYNVDESIIKQNNTLGLFNHIKQRDIIFIPDAKPKVFTSNLFQAVKRRRIFAVPTNGWVQGRGFGMMMHPILHKVTFHKGIDMHCSENTPIFAAASGKISYAGDGGTYGRLIIIQHDNGYETRYAHCSHIYVRIGQEVKKKQCIGRVGHTGQATCAHLHFEVRKNGKPIDPMQFLW